MRRIPLTMYRMHITYPIKTVYLTQMAPHLRLGTIYHQILEISRTLPPKRLLSIHATASLHTKVLGSANTQLSAQLIAAAE